MRRSHRSSRKAANQWGAGIWDNKQTTSAGDEPHDAVMQQTQERSQILYAATCTGQEFTQKKRHKTGMKQTRQSVGDEQLDAVMQQMQQIHDARKPDA